MTNGDAGGPLTGEVLRAVARVYNWPTGHPTGRAVVPIGAAALQQLAGSYSVTANGLTQTLEFAVDGNNLRSNGRPIGTRTFYHGGDERFFLLEIPAEVRFERAASGTVTHVTLLPTGGAPLRMQRIQQ
jgi:hypothetical protein